MSQEPISAPADAGPLEMLLVPRTSDLGDGFSVRRALPHAQRRMVGPFVFFDEMGPVSFEAGRGLDVRPHPHIGLATVTYLHEGQILHRDSLGTVQAIEPGAVNWMTAGQGIVHSERTDAALRQTATRLAGLQVWVALPRAHEEAAPAFAHHARAELPQIDDRGVSLRVVLGDMAGARSPVHVFSDMFYADLALQPGAAFALEAEHEERAVYVLQGEIHLGDGGPPVGAQRMAVLRPGRQVVLRAGADGPARVTLLGGEPMDGPRYVWWNFVSSSKDRIEQAKEDWAAGRFQPVPDETEFIPLPATRPATVSYP